MRAASTLSGCAVALHAQTSFLATATRLALSAIANRLSTIDRTHKKTRIDDPFLVANAGFFGDYTVLSANDTSAGCRRDQ